MSTVVQAPERAPEMLDCGHMSTPNGFAAGWATKPDDTRICYECAANEDRARVRALDDLFAYVQLRAKTCGSQRIAIITWPGIELGLGHMGPPRHVLGGRVQFVEATIEGVHMHGRHYPDAGDYVRLRPYKSQESS